MPLEKNDKDKRSLTKTSRSNDRGLPYKLLSTPVPKNCSLWNHNCIGDKTVLRFLRRTPQMILSKDVLRVGKRLVVSAKELQFTDKLYGNVVFNKDNDELMIYLNDLASSASVDSSTDLKLVAAINFSKKTEVGSKIDGVDPVECTFKKFHHNLEMWTETKCSLSLDCFIFCRVCCTFGVERESVVPFYLQVHLLTPSMIFEASPVRPHNILPTALSRGLSDKSGNAFLYGAPKSGYLTMDECRRLLHILDSDPKVSSLPLVGVWISGVDILHDPFVWCSCFRFVKCKWMSERICQPSEPFLLLHYDTRTFQPRFFNCVLVNHKTSGSSKCLVYFGRTMSAFHTSNVKLDDNDVHIHLGEINQGCGDTDQSDRSVEMTTPCQKLSFATPPNQNNVPIYCPTPRIQFPAFPVCSCRHCLQHLQKANNGDLIPGQVEPANVEDETNIILKTKPVDSNSGLRDSNSFRQLSPEIYQLLVNQEQKLKELQQQVDSLLREQSQSKTRGTALSADDKPVYRKPCQGRGLSSTSTMTSFNWPPAVATCPKCSCKADATTQMTSSESDNGEAREPSFEEHEPDDDTTTQSMEQIRRDGSMLSWNGVEDSLMNLQLPTFSTDSDSQHSLSHVDLQEYHHSFASSNKVSRQLNHGIVVRSSSSSSPPQRGFVENGSSFYDSLLRRVEAFVPHQTLENRYTLIHAHNCCTVLNRPLFDSLFLPHLNYISLKLSDIEGNRSTAFGPLARKYLKDGQSDTKYADDASNVGPATTSLGVELSFATMQYLRKYRL